MEHPSTLYVPTLSWAAASLPRPPVLDNLIKTKCEILYKARNLLYQKGSNADKMSSMFNTLIIYI